MLHVDRQISPEAWQVPRDKDALEKRPRIRAAAATDQRYRYFAPASGQC